MIEMLESTVTVRGQTTLPKSVRSALGVQAGDKVRYLVSGEEVKILRVKSVSSLRNILAEKVQNPVTISEMDAVIADAAMESNK
ncbi:MAG: AbrB/MazE/SpoVT family DNA-binding domain-containing protein [Porticoccaceae bacterium]